MGKIWLILELLLFSLLIFGCTSITNSFASLGTTDRADLIMHPEKYLDQNVTLVEDGIGTSGISQKIILIPGSGDAYLKSRTIQYAISTKDEEGKPFMLWVAYPHLYCNKCKITGVVKKISLCSCYEVGLIGSEYDYAKRLVAEGRSLEEVSEAVWEMKKWYTDIMGGSFPQKSPEECEKEPQDTTSGGIAMFKFSRCMSNSTYYVYYVNVTHVTSLD